MHCIHLQLVQWLVSSVWVCNVQDKAAYEDKDTQTISDTTRLTFSSADGVAILLHADTTAASDTP